MLSLEWNSEGVIDNERGENEDDEMTMKMR